MPTTILLDSGYFVGRMQKHWSPKGKMRRAHNSFKKKKTNWFQRQYQFQKALKLLNARKANFWTNKNNKNNKNNKL